MNDGYGIVSQCHGNWQRGKIVRERCREEILQRPKKQEMLNQPKEDNPESKGYAEPETRNLKRAPGDDDAHDFGMDAVPDGRWCDDPRAHRGMDWRRSALLSGCGAGVAAKLGRMGRTCKTGKFHLGRRPRTGKYSSVCGVPGIGGWWWWLWWCTNAVLMMRKIKIDEADQRKARA